MTEQRQKITEQRERFRELEHRLRDEKDKVYSQFQREIQIKSEHVEKLEGQLIEVLNTATLDANENNGRIEQLFDDSRVLLSLYDDSAANYGWSNDCSRSNN
jgi:ABC-type transporter Mla subunit MlaD